MKRIIKVISPKTYKRVKKEPVPAFLDWYLRGEIVGKSIVTSTGSHTQLSQPELDIRQKAYTKLSHYPREITVKNSGRAIELQNFLISAIDSISKNKIAEYSMYLRSYEATKLLIHVYYYNSRGGDKERLRECEIDLGRIADTLEKCNPFFKYHMADCIRFWDIIETNTHLFKTF